MTKAEIVNEIALKTGIDKTSILKTIESCMEIIKESLSKNENVYLRGFGSFIVKERAEKTARNISKKTTIIIPAHLIPAFKPSKTFVAQVKK
ncbi:HU family DNA-binding protein [Dysgonomonas sp. ZJ709]|uniref:HU family DNA-binding protein n=1 Tax=Dysgonomonas sp. ZJ709 TaxID=2709797 RepID=UPI0013EAFFE3|nr:HU family DNA-binding protein [Dysgonomonas sp. ZJ709]